MAVQSNVTAGANLAVRRPSRRGRRRFTMRGRDRLIGCGLVAPAVIALQREHKINVTMNRSSASTGTVEITLEALLG